MAPSDSSVPVLAAPEEQNGAGRRSPALGSRELLQAFARTASSAFNLPAGLAVLCHSSARLFGAASVSAWLHERRSRELVLAASSDAAGAAEGARIRADSELLPAIAMRRDQALRLDGAAPGSPGVIALPLRGRRRALGALVFEGLGRDTDDGLLLDLEDLARQLSAAIENLLLLEDVLRSRRELVQTFDSLEDLVAICDSHLRVVHVNRTLADRCGHPRDRVFDRPLRDLLGEEAGAWLDTVSFVDGSAHGPATYARELDDEVLGGRFTMTVTPVPGTDVGRHGAVFVARDISRQARLEAERRELLRRLARAQEQDALRQFAQKLGRRLQTPLQSVASRARSLASGEGAALRKEAAALSRDTARALEVVDELLALGGIVRRPSKKTPRARR